MFRTSCRYWGFAWFTENVKCPVLGVRKDMPQRRREFSSGKPLSLRTSIWCSLDPGSPSFEMPWFQIFPISTSSDVTGYTWDSISLRLTLEVVRMMAGRLAFQVTYGYFWDPACSTNLWLSQLSETSQCDQLGWRNACSGSHWRKRTPGLSVSPSGTGRARGWGGKPVVKETREDKAFLSLMGVSALYWDLHRRKKSRDNL